MLVGKIDRFYNSVLCCIFVGVLENIEKEDKKSLWARVKSWLAGLSFRTGVVVLGVCVLCYVISFAQMLLPISVGAKGVLWFVFFGLAKTAQYSGLLIIGKAGIERIKNWRKNKKG